MSNVSHFLDTRYPTGKKSGILVFDYSTLPAPPPTPHFPPLREYFCHQETKRSTTQTSFFTILGIHSSRTIFKSWFTEKFLQFEGQKNWWITESRKQTLSSSPSTPGLRTSKSAKLTILLNPSGELETSTQIRPKWRKCNSSWWKNKASTAQTCRTVRHLETS